MPIRTDFDPRQLLDDPVRLAETTDAADASALKMQASLHRQRVGAAQTKLRRARETGAPPDEIEVLTAELAERELRLADVADTFAVANVKKPEPDEETAKVFGVTRGTPGKPPCTAALVGSNGEILATAPVAENGSFEIVLGERVEGARVQISDSAQQVLYRDGEAETIVPGRIAYRRIALSGPVPKPSPPPETLTTPDLIGQTEDAACAILFRLGVRDITIDRKVAPGPAGLVIDQSPQAGTALDPQAGARLVISESEDDGPAPAQTMPDLIGQPLREAQAAAERLGLRVEVVGQRSPRPTGTVIAQKPEPGATITLPARANLTVSAGSRDEPDAEEVVVPDLTGRSLSEALAAGERLGLSFEVERVRDDAPAGTVVKQDPQAGTKVTPPVTGTLSVSSGAEREDFARQLAARMARDDRLGRIGFDAEKAAEFLRGQGVRTAADGNRLVSLGNAELRERLGVDRLQTAVTFRSIMRAALQETG